MLKTCLTQETYLPKPLLPSAVMRRGLFCVLFFLD
jgi:hypothetical protein